MTLLLAATAVLTVLPVGLIAWNMTLFPRPRGSVQDVSVIVPARNEALNMDACLVALRRACGPGMQIVVVDDHSTDVTAAIVARHAAEDPRIAMVVPDALPPGWAGKPHACLAGARAATRANLLFVDADVRLAPGAAARFAGERVRQDVALASGFPREVTLTAGEMLLVPLIHVLLLGYLPFALMRSRGDVGLGAGCGQIMVAEAAAYHAIGGHGAVRRSWHDGVTLPRAFRARGHMTGLFDATLDAECRMYAGFAATWRGFAKNAREGLAKPAALPVWTVLLGGGWVLPWLALFVPGGWPWAILAASLMARAAIAWRFRQNPLAVLLTPVGMAAMLVLQWSALTRGAGAGTWRGRPQTS